MAELTLGYRQFAPPPPPPPLPPPPLPSFSLPILSQRDERKRKRLFFEGKIEEHHDAHETTTIPMIELNMDHQEEDNLKYIPKMVNLPTLAPKLYRRGDPLGYTDEELAALSDYDRQVYYINNYLENCDIQHDSTIESVRNSGQLDKINLHALNERSINFAIENVLLRRQLKHRVKHDREYSLALAKLDYIKYDTDPYTVEDLVMNDVKESSSVSPASLVIGLEFRIFYLSYERRMRKSDPELRLVYEEIVNNLYDGILQAIDEKDLRAEAYYEDPRSGLMECFGVY